MGNVFKSIAVVGDPHFDDRTPASRIDDYSRTVLDKLASILVECKQRDVRCVVLLGDVFSRRSVSLAYLIDVVLAFRTFRESGVIVYSLVGNHDIQFNRMDTVHTGPLGLLFRAGLVHRLDRIRITTPAGPVTLHGFHYGQHFELGEEPDTKINIGFAHHFYEDQHDPVVLTADDVRRLPIQVWYSGHDHRRHPVTRVDRRLVVRPGSLMRATADLDQVERDVGIEFLHFLDDGRMQPESFVVPHAPANEVFAHRVVERAEKTDEIRLSLQATVTELLAEMETVISRGSPIYDLLDGIKIDERVKARIEGALAARGYLRQAPVEEGAVGYGSRGERHEDSA